MFRVLKPGGHLVLNVAALPALRGNHSVLGGEVRRYTKAPPALGARARRVHRRAADLHELQILPIVAATRWFQRLSGHKESAAEISVPAAPVNAALTAVLAVESLALHVVDMPLGSSVLTLARKPRDLSRATATEKPSTQRNGGTEDAG